MIAVLLLPYRIVRYLLYTEVIGFFKKGLNEKDIFRSDCNCFVDFYFCKADGCSANDFNFTIIGGTGTGMGAAQSL